MSKVTVEQTAKIEISGSDTVANLKELLNKIPDSAIASVYVMQGDRPWETDVNYLKFTWTEEL